MSVFAVWLLAAFFGLFGADRYLDRANTRPGGGSFHAMDDGAGQPPVCGVVITCEG